MAFKLLIVLIMRKIRLILITLVFIIVSPVYAFAGICIFGSCTSVSVNVGGNNNTSATAEIGPGGAMTLKVESVTVPSSNQIDPKPFGNPKTPERILIFNDNNFLLGGATQISPENSNPKIYVTARHVLAGKKNVSGVIGDKNINLSQYKLIQVKTDESQNWLDIVFLVESNESMNHSFTDVSDPYIHFIINAINLYSIAPISTTSNTSSWYTWNYGNIDGRPISGLSMGILTEVNGQSPYFWTGESEFNSTSPGSSGSVVWQSSGQTNEVNPVGVVQCMQIPAPDEAFKSLVKPRPRVFKLKFLLNEDLVWVWDHIKSIDELLSGPPQPHEPNCFQIDGRNAGGDNAINND